MPYSFYASVRDGKQHGFLAGPFRSHTEALAALPAAKRRAHQVNFQSAFYGFGTCRVEGRMKPGLLNDDLGITTDPRGYARLTGPLRPAWQHELNKRITGVEWDEDKYFALEADRRKVEDYCQRRMIHSGCRNHLSTARMRRRYPHINNQEET